MTFIKVGDRLFNLAQVCSAQYYASAKSSSSALFLYFPNRGGEAKVYGAVADQLWSALLEEIKDLVVIDESSLTEANL
jgi:hypothetical protein